MSDEIEYFDYKIDGIEAYSAVLGEAGIEVSQLEPGLLKGHHMRLRFPEFESSWVKTNLSIRGRGQLPGDAWTVSLILNADGRSFQHGVEVGTGTMVVHRPGIVHDGIYGSGFSVVCFGIPAHIFEQRLNREFPELENILTRPWNIFSVSGQKKNELISSYLEAFELVRSSEAIRNSATAFKSLVDELLYDYLLTLVGKEQVSPCDKLVNSATIVTKSEQLIYESRNNVLSVGDLCAGVDVSRRTLSRAFHQITGIGPATHLRRIRLNGARKSILRSNGDGKSISEIAIEYGFWHFSRFAEQYRELFGESPSATKSRYL